jgi:hypothetical protein
MRWPKRLACLPATLAGFALSMIAAQMAYRALQAGCTDYWPKAPRTGRKPFELSGNPPIQQPVSERP